MYSAVPHGQTSYVHRQEIEEY